MLYGINDILIHSQIPNGKYDHSFLAKLNKVYKLSADFFFRIELK